MARPLSPALSAGSDGGTTPSASSRRLVRQLLVDAHAHEEGVQATLYCKVRSLMNLLQLSRLIIVYLQVVLPTSSSSPSHHLVSLLPLSHLSNSSVHVLPLSTGAPLSAIEAARKLGLAGLHDGEGTVRQRAGAAGRRRSSAASDLLLRLNGVEAEGGLEKQRVPDVEVVQQGDEVALCVNAEGREEDAARTGGDALDTPKAARGSPVLGTSTPSAEYLVVLEVEVGFGALKLPRFADSVCNARYV